MLNPVRREAIPIRVPIGATWPPIHAKGLGLGSAEDPTLSYILTMGHEVCWQYCLIRSSQGFHSNQ